MDRRCACPPDIPTPPSPMSVAYPSGREVMNSSIPAAVAAARIFSILLSGEVVGRP